MALKLFAPAWEISVELQEWIDSRCNCNRERELVVSKRLMEGLLRETVYLAEQMIYHRSAAAIRVTAAFFRSGTAPPIPRQPPRR
jgi:hypothetical protein